MNKFFFIVTGLALVTLFAGIALNTAQAQDSLQVRCEQSGGEWTTEEVCKPLPDGTYDCTQANQCQCPAGLGLNAYGVCIEPLKEGIPPETQSECEEISGADWRVIGKDRSTGEPIFGCQCSKGEYFPQTEKKCQAVPDEYLCRKTAGVFGDNGCECPAGQSFVQREGCSGQIIAMGSLGNRTTIWIIAAIVLVLILSLTAFRKKSA